MGAEQSTTKNMSSSDTRTRLHRWLDPANVMGSIEAMPIEQVDNTFSSQPEPEQLLMITTDIPSSTANIASSSDAPPNHLHNQPIVSSMSSHISLSLDELPQLTDVSLQEEQEEQEEDFEIEPQHPEQTPPHVKHGRVNSNVTEEVVDEALARIVPSAMLPFLKLESKENQHADIQRKHSQLPRRPLV